MDIKESLMSNAAVHLLDSFDSLPVDEQRTVALSILKKLQDADYGEFTDEELSAIAEETLLYLDEEESSRGNPI
jgi:hypothetical protein